MSTAINRPMTIADVADDIRALCDTGIHFVALHSHFILAARVDGDRWSCFGGVVPGKVHEAEVDEVLRYGVRQSEAIARAAFQEFAHLRYETR